MKKTRRWGITGACLCVLAISFSALPTASASDGGPSTVKPSSMRATPGAAARMRRAIVACANRKRRAAGLSALRVAGVLTRAAQLHAGNMARQDFFSHTDRRGRNFWHRVAMFDRKREFFARSENIAVGNVPINRICAGWMQSSGHRKNMLDPDVTWIGAGFATGGSWGRYFVQVFGTRR